MFSVCSLILVCALIAAGCGRQNNTVSSPGQTQATPTIDQTPVTLTIGTPFGETDPADQLLADAVQKKYPYISLKFLKYDKGQQLSDLVSQNTVPDILEDYLSPFQTWEDLGVAYDLTDLAAKYKLDLNRYDSNYMDTFHNAATDSSKLYALPFFKFVNVLYYNKDLFDKFNVPYPKDGMTWPEILDLEKKLARQDGDVRYQGFDFRDPLRPADEYPLLTVDPKTDKAQVTSDQWTKYVQFYKSFYDVPNNIPNDTKQINSGYTGFLTDRTLAMWPTGVDHWGDLFKTASANGLNWDMVQFPTWPDAPNQGPTLSGRMLGISSASQHKDVALQVISYVGSDEVQSELSKIGDVPAIKNIAVYQDHGKNVPILQGKNINAVYSNKYAVAKQSKYEALGHAILMTYMNDIALGNIDVNTALRQANEQIDAEIAKQKQSESK